MLQHEKSCLSLKQIPLPSAVPSAGPKDLNAVAVDHTTVEVMWGAIPIADRNGIITGFKVNPNCLTAPGVMSGHRLRYKNKGRWLGKLIDRTPHMLADIGFESN